MDKLWLLQPTICDIHNLLCIIIFETRYKLLPIICKTFRDNEMIGKEEILPYHNCPNIVHIIFPYISKYTIRWYYKNKLVFEQSICLQIKSIYFIRVDKASPMGLSSLTRVDKDSPMGLSSLIRVDTDSFEQSSLIKDYTKQSSLTFCFVDRIYSDNILNKIKYIIDKYGENNISTTKIKYIMKKCYRRIYNYCANIYIINRYIFENEFVEQLNVEIYNLYHGSSYPRIYNNILIAEVGSISLNSINIDNLILYTHNSFDINMCEILFNWISCKSGRQVFLIFGGSRNIIYGDLIKNNYFITLTTDINFKVQIQ